jgi:hypothetical protein
MQLKPPSQSLVIGGKVREPSVAPLPTLWNVVGAETLSGADDGMRIVKEDQFVSDRDVETIRP